MELPGEDDRTRGTHRNPATRFQTRAYEFDASLEWEGWEGRPSPQTEYIRDDTKTIIAWNKSPDVGFEASINPYRGCEHGCIYCYARPFHEFLDYSAGLDFETKILVKEKAPDLLRKALMSRKWKPQVVAVSGATDAYQPAERRFQLTRGCLEVFAEFRNPVAIITKNALIERDIDLLSELASHNAAAVYVSVTTLNDELRSAMEPRTTPPARRLETIRRLNEAGVPTGVLVGPCIPGLTDHELPSIVSEAAKAGARFASYIALRLPHAVAELFEAWLEDRFPLKKEKVLSRIRQIRDGELNDRNFGSRMSGKGVFADQMARMFEVACRKAGFEGKGADLTAVNFRRPDGPQLSLF